MSTDRKMTARQYMTETEVARVLGVEKPTMSNWRRARTGPPYFKFGGHIRYLEEDVVAFIEASRVEPGAAA